MCPVFYSAKRYSYGVALMTRLVKIMTPGCCRMHLDMELIETHHNQKQDAPSGDRSLMLLNAMDPD